MLCGQEQHRERLTQSRPLQYLHVPLRLQLKEYLTHTHTDVNTFLLLGNSQSYVRRYLDQPCCMLTTAIPDVEIWAVRLFAVWF